MMKPRTFYELDAYLKQLPRPEYSVRAVAFLDILGWSNLFQAEAATHIPNTLVDVIEFLRTEFELHRFSNAHESDEDDLRIAHFSDSIILSSGTSMTDLDALLRTVSHFAGWLLAQGELPVRGGISIGPVFHNEGTVVGPALIRAYELESKHAVYPRVIWDPKDVSLLRSIPMYSWDEEMNRSLVEGYLSNYGRQDDDGYFFSDFLPHHSASYWESERWIAECCAKFAPHSKIYEKYDWLRKYLASKKYSAADDDVLPF